MNKPLLIIVCGRPGSGKTTLAHVISETLRCPVISRDELKEGYINTIGREHKNISSEEVKNVNDGFFDLIELLADHYISIVVESAFQHKLWAPRYEALSGKTAIKLIVCKTGNATANKRFMDRKAKDPLREYYHGDNVVLNENDEYEYNPPQFPVPVLDVDTTDGYKPSLEEIVLFIKQNSNGVNSA